MISLIVKTNNKSIICNSILLNILPYFKIINNSKYYNYVAANTKIVNADIYYTYVNIFFSNDDIINDIYKKIDIKINKKNRSSITIKDFLEMYYIFESMIEANYKNKVLKLIPEWVLNKDKEKIDIFNCISCNSDVYSKCILRNNYYCIYCCLSNDCDIVCIQRNIIDKYKNIINSNKDKYTEYMNIILFKIYKEYEYINNNKNKEIKEFIIDFVNKFYPEEKNNYYMRLLDYNSKTMHFICMKYYSLLYHKYTKIFNDIFYTR